MSQPRTAFRSIVQRLQPASAIDVYCAVEKMDVTDRKMILQSPRRFVKAAPPAVHAGIGNALRQAFDLNGEAHSDKFQRLLDRLG